MPSDEIDGKVTKIGILTMHCVPNYGAIMQSYATVKLIEKLLAGDKKYKVERIDYQPIVKRKRYSDAALVRDSLLSLRSAYNNIRLLGSKSRSISKKVHNLAYNFYVNRGILSSNVIKEQLSEYCKKYDAIIVGSDQVWNPYGMTHDGTYLLGFYQKHTKYSFSSSFGISVFPNEFKKIYSKRLSEFRKVSIREEAGVKIYKDLVDRNDAVVTLDPTLCLTSEDYLILEDDAAGSYLPDEYILIYLAMNSETLIKKVTETAKIPIVIFGMPDIVSDIDDRTYKIIKYASPGQFLYIFKNAMEIYTNSFHCIAFSLIYNKQFWIEYNDKYSQSNSRLENIVHMLGLEDRLITEASLQRVISYGVINKKLEEKRKESIKYMSEILQDIPVGEGVFRD